MNVKCDLILIPNFTSLYASFHYNVHACIRCVHVHNMCICVCVHVCMSVCVRACVRVCEVPRDHTYRCTVSGGKVMWAREVKGAGCLEHSTLLPFFFLVPTMVHWQLGTQASTTTAITIISTTANDHQYFPCGRVQLLWFLMFSRLL